MTSAVRRDEFLLGAQQASQAGKHGDGMRSIYFTVWP